MQDTFTPTLDSWPSWPVIARPVLLLTLLVLPGATWLAALGNPVTYFRFDLPPGQTAYILVKLAGLYLFVLLWLQVMFALLKGDPRARNLLPDWTVRKHRLLGIATLLVAWAHFLLFFTAVSLRKDAIGYDLLLPQFSNGIYFVAVSLGWFALAGLNVVALTGLLRMRTGGIWSLAHRLSLGVFCVGLVHAQMIGSEAKTTLWFALQLGLAAAVLVALFRRLSR